MLIIKDDQYFEIFVLQYMYNMHAGLSIFCNIYLVLQINHVLELGLWLQLKNFPIQAVYYLYQVIEYFYCKFLVFQAACTCTCNWA